MAHLGRFLATAFLIALSAPVSAQGPLGIEAAEKAVTEASNRFVIHREEGELVRAYAVFSPALQGSMSREMFERNVRQFRDQSGPLRKLQVTRITYYAQERAYAADFMAIYWSGVVECGYFIWIELPDRLALHRIERNFIPADIWRSGTAQPLIEQFKCIPPDKGTDWNEGS